MLIDMTSLNVVEKTAQINTTSKRLLPNVKLQHERAIMPDGIARGVASMTENEQILISRMLATLNCAQQTGLKLSLDELRPHIQNISNQDLGHVFFDMLSQISHK